MKHCKIDIRNATINSILKQTIPDINYTLSNGNIELNQEIDLNIINNYKPDILQVEKVSNTLLNTFVNPNFINQKFNELPTEKQNNVEVDLSKDEEHFNKQNNVQYQLNDNSNTEGIIASEKTIRDVAARMADRIGLNVRFEADKSKNYKGKLEGNTAVVNLANATLDTPIHEILGHPIIRAIKGGYSTQSQYINTEIEITKKLLNKEITKEQAKELRQQRDNPQFSQLYNNLLKELETGTGKEVLDRIKRDYNLKDTSEFYIKNYEENGVIKGYNVSSTLKQSSTFFKTIDEANEFIKTKQTLQKYSLEEQQEESIVELLGLMTAKKLDNVKDGKLISLLKRLLESISEFMRGLLKSKEIDVSKLPDNMTLGNISDLLAYSNSKLILPGYEVKYTTPDNNNFQTYSEANNHISQLAKDVKDVDLSNIGINNLRVDLIDKFNNNKQINKIYSDYIQEEGLNYHEVSVFYIDGTVNKYEYDSLPKEQYDFYRNIEFNKSQSSDLNNFVEKNKEYEQSKDIIEEWKKVNNIQYNPEEIYSRGQEFVSIVGAYSDFDVNLMMQNLLHHIEDNQKAGGQFAISAITKPIDRKIGHLEGDGGKIRFKIYPKSENILWASNTDVYSGSVWDASTKVNKDKKSELLGVTYTKYPSLNNVNTIQPNLASVVDDLAHHHNELAISLNFSNFELEVDDDIPYQTKKIIGNVNKILQQKRLEQINNFVESLEKECK